MDSKLDHRILAMSTNSSPEWDTCIRRRERPNTDDSGVANERVPAGWRIVFRRQPGELLEPSGSVAR